jgi:uncharacterized damage-inducible protein DinB
LPADYDPAVARSGIETMLYLLDEAFRGVGIEQSNESQALMPNLRSVPDDAWHALPEGLSRSIESIAVHVGTTKLVYGNHAFGDASLRFDQTEVEPWPRGEAEMADVLPWLEGIHDDFVRQVAALGDDVELDRDRRANWGEQRPTRWLIAAMITHDAYHAGEINHLRSFLGPDDRWRFEQLGFG